MRIALVYPRLISQYKSNLFPLGITYIATILKQNGYEVKMFDSSWDKDLKPMKKKIKKYKPDIVGISATSDMVRNVKKTFDFTKKLGCINILGGPHSTIVPEETLEMIKSVDIIVYGEGENTILELLRNIESKKEIKNVKGLYYRKDDKIIRTENREINDINNLPIPDRDMIPNFNRYLNSGIIGISLLRGCPYGCKFCQPAETKVSGGKSRFRTPRLIAEELDYLVKKYNRNEFYIGNDLFTEKREWIEEIYQEMKKLNLIGKVRFIILSRVDLIDEKFTIFLKKFGVSRMLLGVESGSEKVLKYLNKGIKLERIRETFRIVEKHGIKTHALMMLGSPAETTETLKDTEKLLNEIKPTQILFALFTALPGTYLHDQLKRENKLLFNSYEQYDYYGFVKDGPNVKINMDYQEILEFKKRILKNRKKGMLIGNLKSLFNDIVINWNFKLPYARWQTYNRCKDFFG